ncbi:MAG: TOBE domain-containing protein, partial [candidate division NC10 bacterium]
FAPGSEVEVAIRPERVQLATAQRDNVLEGRIVRLSYQGALTEVTTEVAGGQRLLAFVTEPAPAPLATEQTVRLHLPPDAFTVL